MLFSSEALTVVAGQPLGGQRGAHRLDDRLLVAGREVAPLLAAVRRPPAGVGLVERLERAEGDAQACRGSASPPRSGSRRTRRRSRPSGCSSRRCCPRRSRSSSSSRAASSRTPRGSTPARRASTIRCRIARWFASAVQSQVPARRLEAGHLARTAPCGRAPGSRRRRCCSGRCCSRGRSSDRRRRRRRALRLAALQPPTWFAHQQRLVPQPSNVWWRTAGLTLTSVVPGAAVTVGRAPPAPLPPLAPPDRAAAATRRAARPAPRRAAHAAPAPPAPPRRRRAAAPPAPPAPARRLRRRRRTVAARCSGVRAARARSTVRTRPRPPPRRRRDRRPPGHRRSAAGRRRRSVVAATRRRPAAATRNRRERRAAPGAIRPSRAMVTLMPAVRDAGERQADEEVAVVALARDRLQEADVGGDVVGVEADAVADEDAVDVLEIVATPVRPAADVTSPSSFTWRPTRERPSHRRSPVVARCRSPGDGQLVGRARRHERRAVLPQAVAGEAPAPTV